MAKRRKCMADGGVVDKANERVQQAVRGLAGFMNIGSPATTEVMSGGRTNVPDGRPIVQADTRPDMPQERNQRRFDDEVDQRKQARSGGYKDGAVPLPQDGSAIRINQQAQTVYPGGIASFLSGVPDAIRAPTQHLGPNLAESAAPVGMSPQSQGLLTGIKDYSTTPAQLANSGKPAFVNEDGSARNMGPAVPPVMQQPIMTMKERDIAAGVDPGRAYRPGSAADPYASGNVSRAAAPASPFATDQQYSPLQPLDTRSRRQRRQAGFADGGMVRFAGKGGPREDEIPVTVAGEHIKVSDGEAAVILPAKTAANAAALGIIGQVIKATNDGRAPKMGIDDGEEYQRGALPDEEELRRSQGQIGGAAFVRGDAPAPALQLAQGQIDGQPFVRPQTAAAAPAKPPITAPEMYAPAYQAIAQAPAAAQGIVGRVFGALPEGGFLKDPAVRQKLGSVIAGEGLFSGGISGQAQAAPLSTAPAMTGAPAPATAQAQQAAPVASPSLAAAVQPAAATETADQTTNRGGIVTAAMGRGFDPTKLNMAQGYGMASNAAGKTLSVGPSQYIAADGSQTSRWEDTQAYKDAIARNEADKMQLAEMQSRRLGADPMAIQTARQGIASAVLGNKAKEAEMQRNQFIQSLVSRAATETDPMKQRAIIDTALAAQGKDSKHGKNLQVVDLGEYSVPDGVGGLKVVKRGQALYDADSKQVIPITPGQGGQQTAASPYPDGTKIKDKEGKQYVVRNGVPVPEGV